MRCKGKAIFCICKFFEQKNAKKCNFSHFCSIFRPSNRPKPGRRAPKTIRKLSANNLQTIRKFPQLRSRYANCCIAISLA